MLRLNVDLFMTHALKTRFDNIVLIAPSHNTVTKMSKINAHDFFEFDT